MAQAYRNIAIIHPAAIGDVMFGTPVAATLKENFPDSHLTYWSHESLFDLLRLCPFIDSLTPFNRKSGILAQRKQLNDFNADLIVDLVGSTRTKMITVFNKSKVLTHDKSEFKRRPDLHIVDSLLSTLSPLNLRHLDNKYPTLKTNQSLLPNISEVVHKAKQEGKNILALVPSVGTLRPHRAWPIEKWIALLEKIQAESTFYPVLIGGKEDAEICGKIKLAFNNKIPSFAGILSLPQTATLLAASSFVVSADTGPAHLAVAVGTPVLGLYGPTLPARNGPYGNVSTAINNCSQCQCQTEKFCRLTTEKGPGLCMQQIEVLPVWTSIMACRHRA